MIRVSVRLDQARRNLLYEILLKIIGKHRSSSPAGQLSAIPFSLITALASFVNTNTVKTLSGMMSNMVLDARPMIWEARVDVESVLPVILSRRAMDSGKM
jgi:hypothetical protein